MEDAPSQLWPGRRSNVRRALEVARTCRAILGASGITVEYPPLRQASDLDLVLTYQGTEEIHTLIVGGGLTGLAAYR